MNCFNYDCDKQRGGVCLMDADMTMCGYKKRFNDLTPFEKGWSLSLSGVKHPPIHPDSPVGREIRKLATRSISPGNTVQTIHDKNNLIAILNAEIKHLRDELDEGCKYLEEVIDRNTKLSDELKCRSFDKKHDITKLEEENRKLKLDLSSLKSHLGYYFKPDGSYTYYRGDGTE